MPDITVLLPVGWVILTLLMVKILKEVFSGGVRIRKPTAKDTAAVARVKCQAYGAEGSFRCKLHRRRQS